MTGAPFTQHFTFSIERTYDAPPHRVFLALANPEEKAKWFSGPRGQWKPLVREFDFRVGGRERARGEWLDGTTSDFQATYCDIVDDRRVVYSYDMYVNDKRISVSLATIELQSLGERTQLNFTEHVVYLDGYPTPEDREQGSAQLLDNLGTQLNGAKAAV
ncbi:MAG: SRPBCC family protein [Candidatus Aquilonibacter sp.]